MQNIGQKSISTPNQQWPKLCIFFLLILALAVLTLTWYVVNLNQHHIDDLSRLEKSGAKKAISGQSFGELSQLGKGRTDKELARHGFTEAYEHIFAPIKDSTKKFCEIGVKEGGSMLMWQEYFTNAKIYGIDIVDCSQFDSERISTFIGDQANRQKLQAFIDKFGSGYDIILDDGGHSMEQQQVSFAFFFKHLKPGGYYVIEDVHTSLPKYYPNTRYGVEKDKKNTTLTMINKLIAKSTVESVYMKPIEIKYLSKNIENCFLFFRNNKLHSITCIFQKRDNKN